MTCLRICRAIKLLSRIFKFWKFENSKINFFLRIQLLEFLPQNQTFPKTGTQVEWQWLMNMFTKFQVDIINLRTPAAPHTRRRILLSSTVYFTSFQARHTIITLYLKTTFDNIFKRIVTSLYQSLNLGTGAVIYYGTPVCRLCGRYLAILSRPIKITVPSVTVVPTAMVGSLIRSSNLPHSLQRGVHTKTRPFYPLAHVQLRNENSCKRSASPGASNQYTSKTPYWAIDERALGKKR